MDKRFSRKFFNLNALIFVSVNIFKDALFSKYANSKNIHRDSKTTKRSSGDARNQ